MWSAIPCQLASAPSAGAPLLALFFAAYMAAGLVTAAFLNAHSTAHDPGRGWTLLRTPDAGSFAAVAVLALSITANRGFGAMLAATAIAFGLAAGSTLAGTRA